MPTQRLEVTVVWPQGASAKNNPNTGGSAVYVFRQGEKFYASEIVADTTDLTNPDKKWAKVSEGLYAGKYVAVRYPSSNGNPVRCTYVDVTNPGPDPTPDPDTPHLVATIETFSDGSYKVTDA